VHVPSRSFRIPAAGGVCDRSRHRSGRGPQPGTTAAPVTARRGTVAARLVSDRRPSCHHRTFVRRASPGTGAVAVGSRAGHAPVGFRRFRRELAGDPAAPAGAAVGPRRTAGLIGPRLQRMILWYQRGLEGRPSPCRFTPSCSSYALEALDTHGTWRGVRLTIRRLLRCRPFGPSGWDPVPEPRPRDLRKRADAR